MNALSTTIVNATSAKRYELPRTRLSLYYLVGYTLPVGLALMFVPQMTMQLLFSNHVYDDLGLRIGGVFLFAIGLIVAGMIIREESRAYAVTLFVRAFIITALLTLYTQYGDPALLATSTVVTIGWILTFLGWRKDTAEQRG
jgi:O-antigen/teichoic acid export membrane protein